MFFFSYRTALGQHIVRSEADLSSSPVSSLGVVLDLVVSLVSDPVGKSSVLLDHVADLHLSSESLD